MGVTETIAGIFGFGILAYFTWKVILPGLQNVSSLQPPSLPFQLPQYQPAQPSSYTPPQPQSQSPLKSPKEKSIPLPDTSNMTNPNVPGTQFTFNVVGDIDYYEGTGQNLCGGNPSLALIIGDFSYDCNAQKWWTTTMRACNGKNVIASVGNHDCSGKGFIDLFPANGGKWEFIKKMGNIAFIAVNTGYCNAQCSNPSTSEGLFKQAQADPSVKWIIVHMHKPVFTAGTAPDAPMSYHTMFQRYSKVKMVFAGHNHTYKRYVILNGIQYITAGRGGHDASKGSGSVTKGPSSGTVGVAKCRVDANGGITCQYVANSGEILDQWGLTADGKHTGTGGVTPKQGSAPGESANFAQAFFSQLDPLDYPTKEEKDNEFLFMMDRLNEKLYPQRKLNNKIYHYSVLPRRRI